MTEPEFVFAPHFTTLTPEGEDLVETTSTPACDFCLDTRTRWEYPCEDFTIDHLRFGSQDGWLACDRCAERIEAGDFGGLVARTIKSWHMRFKEALPLEQIDAMGEIQQGFLDHRTGPRIAYG